MVLFITGTPSIHRCSRMPGSYVRNAVLLLKPARRHPASLAPPAHVVAVPLQLPIAIVQEHATRWGRVRKSATTVRSEQERPLPLAGSSCTRTLETEFELIYWAGSQQHYTAAP